LEPLVASAETLGSFLDSRGISTTIEGPPSIESQRPTTAEADSEPDQLAVIFVVGGVLLCGFCLLLLALCACRCRFRRRQRRKLVPSVQPDLNRPVLSSPRGLAWPRRAMGRGSAVAPSPAPSPRGRQTAARPVTSVQARQPRPAKLPAPAQDDAHVSDTLPTARRARPVRLCASQQPVRELPLGSPQQEGGSGRLFIALSAVRGPISEAGTQAPYTLERTSTGDTLHI
jgi:hypothetical protein